MTARCLTGLDSLRRLYWSVSTQSTEVISEIRMYPSVLEGQPSGEQANDSSLFWIQPSGGRSRLRNLYVATRP